MKTTQILLYLFVFIFLTIEAKKKEYCTKLLNLYSSKYGGYTQCVIEKAYPVMICEKCVVHYLNATEAYANVKHNCSEHFIDKDRLQVVTTMHEHATSLWENAYCKDCYNWTSISIEKQEFSVEAKKFFDLENALNHCIGWNYGDSCNFCEADYITLNSLFKEMEHHKFSKICFDIQDKMNSTRSLWSTELNCSKDARESSLNVFSMFCAFFTILSISFFVIVPYRNSRISTETYLSNNTNEPETSEQEDGFYQTGNIITGYRRKPKKTETKTIESEPQPTTSSKKLVDDTTIFESSDDDDEEDENILVQNKNQLIDL